MTTINKNELQNSQLDTNFQLQNLQREYQSHLRDTNLTPLRIRQIFERAEQGQILEQCDFFADMEERDGHICAELAKRKRGVLGLKWSLQPPHNATPQEVTQAQNVQDLLLELDDFEDVLLNLSEAIGYGFSCLELQWQFSNNVWMPEKLLHRPARWFQLSMFNRDDVRLRDGSSDGAELWQAGWLVHKHKAKSGNASRSGLLRSLAFPYLFKHYALTDFNEFLEIFGLPMIVGKYQTGTSKEDQATLRRAIESIGHSAKGIMPDSMLVEFQQAANTTGDPFKTMIDWCESTQSKIILGATLTSQSTGGTNTNALGNVHQDVFKDLVISDALQIASSLSRLVALIYQVNGFAGRPAKFVFDVNEPEDLALFADALPKLAAAGLEIPMSYAYEKLKIPMPKDGEAILSVLQPAKPTAAMSALSIETIPIKFTPEQQAIENIADSLLDNVTAPISNAQLQQVIRAAKSPEDLENRLAILMQNADFTVFSNTLSRALFAADVLGYVHAI